jgi:hypothetical protein
MLSGAAPNASVRAGSIASNAPRAAGRPQRPRLARSPRLDPARGRAGIGEARRHQPRLELVARMRQAARVRRADGRVHRRHALHMRPQQVEQLVPAARQAVQPRHRLQGGRIVGQAVRLPVLDHLQPVFDRAQQPVGSRQLLRLPGGDPPGRGQRRQRALRARRAQRGLATAMDELVHVREELDLADAAAAALQVVARAECLAVGIMVADPPGDRLELADRAEIERAPPHERVDRLQEIAPDRRVPSDMAGTDERGTLPGQRARLIMRDRRIHRQRDRRHLGRRAQPQIDPEHIALAVPLLDEVGQRLPNPHPGLGRLLARPSRQHGGIVEVEQVHVGRIIELPAAELAESDDGKAARLLARRPGRHHRLQRLLKRLVGEVGQGAHHIVQAEQAGEVADAERQRERAAPAPQSARYIRRACSTFHRIFKRLAEPSCGQRSAHGGPALPLHAQEWRGGIGAGERVYQLFRICSLHVTSRISSVRGAQRLQPQRNPVV